MIANSGSNISKASTRMLVAEQKIIGIFKIDIDKQVAYLILNGSKKSWVKLCEAKE